VGRLIRPLSFIAISVPLFLLWQYALRAPYLRCIAEIFAASARLFGQDIHLYELSGGHLTFSYGEAGWGNEFGLTGINVVPFIALIGSTRGLGWRRGVRLGVIGVGALMVTHILGLWCDVFNFNVRHDPNMLRFADGVRALFTGFGTFLFPLLIWLVLVRDRLPRLGSLQARV
jgi:hypothetical protein